MVEIVDLEATQVVLAVVQAAAARGDGPGMLALAQRTQSLLDPPPLPVGPRAQRQALIDRLHGAIASVVSATLTPAVLADLVTELRAGSDAATFADDPWAPLDAEAARHRAAQVTTGLLQAQAAAVGACRAYEQHRRVGYLRDAVEELESAQRLAREHLGSRMSPATCDREFDRLGRALARVLPLSAWWYLAGGLGHELGAARRGLDWRLSTSLERESDGWFRGRVWDVDLEAQELARGTWFDPQPQAGYEAVMDEIRRKRAADAAALAEQQRKFDEWQARVNAERVQREAEEAATAAAAASERARTAGDEAQLLPAGAATRPSLESLGIDPHDIKSREELAFVPMRPEMREVCEAEFDRRDRRDAEIAQRKRDHEEYELQLRTRR